MNRFVNAAPRRDAALREHAPEPGDFRADVIGGLSSGRKTLPCKYLYDDRGAELFERICGLDAYYPTRVERSILEAHGREMSRLLRRHCRVVEFGSGSALKTQLLLAYLDDPVAYVPIDISRAQLVASAERLALRFPALQVLPLCA
ncbi:MAG: L-histidine N(alpha)-methyltransferase, partial [Longimicrobiales bacterium]